MSVSSSTFKPLEFNIPYKLSCEEAAQHEIGKDGISKHAVYKDSVFSFTFYGASKTSYGPSSNERVVWSKPYYMVVRLNKEGDLPPLNTPVSWTCQKVSKLEIDKYGYSSRADLKNYRFDCVYEGRKGNEICYQITMRKK